MKAVPCYGDSITWGYNPVDGVHPDADGQQRLGEAIAKIIVA